MAAIMIESDRMSLDYEKITIADASIGFTAAKIKGPGTEWSPTRGCQEVLCTFEIASDGARFKTNGTAPTTTDGHLIENGDTISIKNPHDILNFRAIRTAAVSGTLHVTYKF